MIITRAEPRDVSPIRSIYTDAQALQRSRRSGEWLDFGEDILLEDISAGRLFKVIADDVLAGAFILVERDDAIWGDLERGDHLYLHRIARSAQHRGKGLFADVLEWARARCRALGRAGVRMDTWANNETLLRYYERHGFRLVRRSLIGMESALPAHYRGIELALLQDTYSPTRMP
jgi:ribosomal protein S18 acetylase RimI-like enzyme